jgi:two-component system, NtrC family, sensor kinase
VHRIGVPLIRACGAIALPAGVPVWIGQGTLPLSREVVLGRAVLDRTMLHVPDLQAETEEYPEGTKFARRLGHRTILAVPLIRDRDAIGAIIVRRTEVRPSTDRQIELVKTFADQAIIAIENARLLKLLGQIGR